VDLIVPKNYFRTIEQFADPSLSLKQLEIKIIKQLEIIPLLRSALIISGSIETNLLYQPM
jgi:hypothetical protein